MIFISHAHEDEALATRLCAAIEKIGRQCWIAPRDVTPGQSYAVEIMRGLEASDVVVLLLSKHANASDMVEREIERAVNKKKTVIPLRILGTLPAGGLEYLLGARQWIEAGDVPIEQCVERVVGAIPRIEGADAATRSMAHHVPVKPEPPAASEKQPSQDPPSTHALEVDSYLPPRKLSYWKAFGLRLLLGFGLPHVDETLRKAAGKNTVAQATTVVALSSIAAGVGSFAQNGFAGIIVTTLGTLLGWYVWAYLTYFIGTRFLAEPQTKADLGELLRAIGFSSSPGLLRVLGIIPGLNQIVFFVTGLWMLIAMIIAVRQALDYTATWRAIAVCVIGWIVQLLLLVLLFLALGLNPST